MVNNDDIHWTFDGCKNFGFLDEEWDHKKKGNKGSKNKRR
jgi:hypothetical protein